VLSFGYVFIVWIHTRGLIDTDATDSVRCRPRTGGGSHGDDTESDGTSLVGPQSYKGDKREFSRCIVGSLRVRVGAEGRRPPESGGRIPPPLAVVGNIISVYIRNHTQFDSREEMIAFQIICRFHIEESQQYHRTHRVIARLSQSQLR
jgi:hypothetical protein